jgi:hypothetical protein
MSDINIYKYLIKEYNFYYDIINAYLQNEFISSKDKLKLTKILKMLKSLK